MKALPKSDKIKALIAPKMTDIITFLKKKGKSAIYTGGNIHGLYRYLDIIWDPTTLTTSGCCSHHFGPSSSTNNDAETIQPVIVDICVRQKTICKWCGRIGHKTDAWITRGPNFLPPIIRRKMNQFNTLHGDEPTEPPGKRNIQPPEVHFKHRTYPSKTSPMILAIMGRLNKHAVDNGDIEVSPLDLVQPKTSTFSTHTRNWGH